MLDATYDREIRKAFEKAPALRGRLMPIGASLELWHGDDATDIAAFIDGEQRWAYRVCHLVPVRKYGQDRELPEAEIVERLKRAAVSLAFSAMDDVPVRPNRMR